MDDELLRRLESGPEERTEDERIAHAAVMAKAAEMESEFTGTPLTPEQASEVDSPFLVHSGLQAKLDRHDGTIDSYGMLEYMVAFSAVDDETPGLGHVEENFPQVPSEYVYDTLRWMASEFHFDVDMVVGRHPELGVCVVLRSVPIVEEEVAS